VPGGGMVLATGAGTAAAFLGAFLDTKDLFVQQRAPGSRRGGDSWVQSE
jgi:hypothetical protein